MAHSSRGWRGARTPSSLKRVRQSHRRNAILQPRRSEAKTQVRNALTVAAGGDPEATGKALAEAMAALDRAAKTGAIHPNNAARRKSRLMLHANAALGGQSLAGSAKPQRQVSRAAAAKAAKARIAAGKATKAKGEQTAAGKARAALSRSARDTKANAEGTTTADEPGKPAAKAKSSSTRSKATSKARTKTTAKTKE